MKRRLASSLKKLILCLSPSAVRFFYITICKPRPLRWMANKAISAMMPDSVKIEEGEVFLDKYDVGSSGALAFGAHDPFEVELFRKDVRPGMTVVDMGANIGYYTVIAAGRVGPTGRVFAYEPEEKNFAILEKNIAKNGFSWATAVKLALSDRAGARTLFLADAHSGLHSFANNRHQLGEAEVACDTLDSSLKRQGSPKVDIIKMDIEGAEILAIDGMRETLAANRNLVLFSEFNPKAIQGLSRSPIELLEKLRDQGLSLSVIDEDKRELVPLPPSDFEKFVKSFPAKGDDFKNIRAVRN